ncbi:MAG: fatty acid desaturase family protein [Blastocatellia bacterium]
MKATNAAILTSLRQEITARGWHRKATGRILLELHGHLFLALAGMAVIATTDNGWARAGGMIVMATGSIGVGTNTHTSSHYGTSDRRWLNEALTYFGFPFFLGLSATYWWHSHIAVHHPAPNVVGVDDDCDLSPWFAMTQAEIDASRGLRRFYYRHLQWMLLPIGLSANCANYVKSGRAHLFRMLLDRGRRKRAHWIDLGSLVLHQVCYLGLPLFFFATRDVLLFYAVRVVMLGYLMFAVLAPGHFPAEASRRRGGLQNGDFLRLQTANTINFHPGLYGRFLVSGLNHQIEHHLFPNLSHVHYRKLGPIVEKLCRENGLPYHSFGWGKVIWKCWMVFRNPRPIVCGAETKP